MLPVLPGAVPGPVGAQGGVRWVLAKGARVSVWWPTHSAWFVGTVKDHRTSLAVRSKVKHELLVGYDDGDNAWHDVDSTQIMPMCGNPCGGVPDYGSCSSMALAYGADGGVCPVAHATPRGPSQSSAAKPRPAMTPPMLAPSVQQQIDYFSTM